MTQCLTFVYLFLGEPITCLRTQHDRFKIDPPVGGEAARGCVLCALRARALQPLLCGRWEPPLLSSSLTCCRGCTSIACNRCVCVHMVSYKSTTKTDCRTVSPKAESRFFTQKSQNKLNHIAISLALHVWLMLADQAWLIKVTPTAGLQACWPWARWTLTHCLRLWPQPLFFLLPPAVIQALVL